MIFPAAVSDGYLCLTIEETACEQKYGMNAPLI